MSTAELSPVSTDLREDYFRHGFAALSDAELVARVARTLEVPRTDPADSFVLHAPLELVARTALLPSVQPARRELARLRMFALADRFEAFSPPVAAPSAARFDGVGEAARRLIAAIDWGELDDVDEAARWLGRTATPSELRALLTDAIIPRLAAAAHAPIFLFQLPRVSPRGEVSGGMLRGLARELGRNPAWRLHWMNDARAAGSPPAPAGALFDALAATPRRATEGPTPFIYPLMSAVDDDGSAAGLLGGVVGGPDIGSRGRAVLRAAAWSMLREPGDHAPYGWSHCLTMPQAVLGIAGAATAASVPLAVAATYVVGFRSALARRPLEPTFAPEDPRVHWRDALRAPAAVAAAAVWHAAPDDHAAIQGALATEASAQRDAHLVKYTLACIDAAAADPEHGRLFLSAAASLAGWWSQVFDDDDPLAA